MTSDDEKALKRLKDLGVQLDAAKTAQQQAATALNKARRTNRSATKAVKQAATTLFQKRRKTKTKHR